MRILLIEDDTMIGEGLARALKAEGITVDWVATARRPTLRCKAAATRSFCSIWAAGADGLDLLKSARREG